MLSTVFSFMATFAFVPYIVQACGSLLFIPADIIVYYESYGIAKKPKVNVAITFDRLHRYDY